MRIDEDEGGDRPGLGDGGELTPERAERMRRRLYAALAVEHARWVRRRAIKRGLGAGILAVCLASAVVLTLRRTVRADVAGAPALVQGAVRALDSHLARPGGAP